MNVHAKKRIGLVGYFGWGNFGDELFLEAHRQHLGEEFELEVIHDLLSEPYFSRPVEEMIAPYDAILIGGGDLINPVRVSGLYWKEAFLTKPVFVFGIGVPSAKWARNDVIDTYRRFFQHPNCHLVVPRDIESYNWIKSNICPSGQLAWFPDPVCSLKLPAATKAKEKTLGVVMRSHRSLSEDLSSVRTMIDKAKDMGYVVKHLVLANLQLGQADLEMARSIAKSDEEIITSESLDSLCTSIASCSLLASIKFHGMVVATMYGVPTIAMSVTPKNRNFLRMIERPEMLRGYTDKDLWKNLSYFPAAIPKQVSEWLAIHSTLGYELLRKKLCEVLDVDQPCAPLASSSTDAVPKQEIVTQYRSRKSGYQGPLYDAASLQKRAEGRVRELPRRLGVAPEALQGARMLEIGCGNGECTAAAMRIYEADSYGVDIEPRWRDGPYDNLGLEGRLLLLDASGPDITRLGTFDIVHSYTVFEHIERPREALENIFKLLKPGGRAFLSFKLYLGASAAHLLGYLPDMPWIHLTHSDIEIREIMKKRFGVNRGAAWVNRWTSQNYLDTCTGIGFEIDKCWYTRKVPETRFYEEHKNTLGKYNVAELAKNFMHLTLIRPNE